jgi:hypothetical protein
MQKGQEKKGYLRARAEKRKEVVAHSISSISWLLQRALLA